MSSRLSSVTESIVAARRSDEGAGFDELADAGAKAETADKLTATIAAMTTRAHIVVGAGMMTVGRGGESRTPNRGKVREGK